MSESALVSNEENLVRILHKDWIVDGVLQTNAFALRNGETYISVNRPSVDSFSTDVSDFVRKHKGYQIEDGSSFQQAVLNAGDVRGISVSFNQKTANLTVEVEPRDNNIKSHAGIFTRIEGNNIKGGSQQELFFQEGSKVSYEAIHLKVQYALLALSQLEKQKL